MTARPRQPIVARRVPVPGRTGCGDSLPAGALSTRASAAIEDDDPAAIRMDPAPTGSHGRTVAAPG